MNTMFDDTDGPRASTLAIAAAVVVGAFALGAVKVRNELKMTEEYSRWADASQRQAVALEKIAGIGSNVKEQGSCLVYLHPTLGGPVQR